jgi:hypothetical protein
MPVKQKKKKRNIKNEERETALKRRRGRNM